MPKATEAAMPEGRLRTSDVALAQPGFFAIAAALVGLSSVLSFPSKSQQTMIRGRRTPYDHEQCIESVGLRL
jgi:hypothetical protein